MEKNKIKELFKNKLARDIAAFFYANQGSIDTVSGVSAWVHEDKEKTREMLDVLAGRGVLEKDNIGSTNGYCYTRNTNTMKMIKELIESDVQV